MRSGRTVSQPSIQKHWLIIVPKVRGVNSIVTNGATFGSKYYFVAGVGAIIFTIGSEIDIVNPSSLLLSSTAIITLTFVLAAALRGGVAKPTALVAFRLA